MNPKGPKSFGGWIALYEERVHGTFEISPMEELIFDRQHGFFTWTYNPETGHLLIPKMVGDGRYWRRIISDWAKRLQEKYTDFNGILFCTTRKAEVYIRAAGGVLYKQKTNKKGVTYSWILITPQTYNGR